ncbi:DinB family protein [Paenisporosarcina sp. FSL H8-0542]|uniref:DinB family protein n=1 Tax=Paenisporosarcina sp. FSL H8-0542 TaxID=2921401 RepID=UPI003159C522
MKGWDVLSKFENENLLITRNNLLNEMNLLSDEEFNYTPGKKSWSIAQICNHLALTEEIFAKAIAYGLKKSNISAEPKKIDFLLDRSNKLEAPEIVMPQIESAETHQIIDQLSNSRNLLNNILNTVEDTSILVDKSVKHPYFGDLPLYQWIELIYLHEQRHIEQIKEIKSLYQTTR